MVVLGLEAQENPDVLEQQPGVAAVETGLDAALVDLIFRVREPRTTQEATGGRAAHPGRLHNQVKDSAPIRFGATAVRLARPGRHLPSSSHIDLAFNEQPKRSSGTGVTRSKCFEATSVPCAASVGALHSRMFTAHQDAQSIGRVVPCIGPGCFNRSSWSR